MVGDDSSFEREAISLAELPSPRSKLVYIYLHTVNGATIEELHDDLGMQYLELYSVLRVLREGNRRSERPERLHSMSSAETRNRSRR
jgi:hypothetical protein